MGEYLNVCKEMGRKTLKGTSVAFSCFYFAPTFYRKSEDIAMASAGAAVGVFAHCVAGACYAAFTEREFYPLSFPLVPLATNAVSGLYEWARYEHEKVKSKKAPVSPLSSPAVPSPGSTPSGAASSKLEEKVEQEKSKPLVPRDIPNPWDIDIPKIENIVGGEER